MAIPPSSGEKVLSTMSYAPTNWRIVEARLALEDGWAEGDLWIKDGRIAAIGRLPDKAYGPLYQAKGAYLLPGLIDTHVHFREPGFLEKGTFYTESRAALASGVTTVFDMPNTHPPTTTREALAAKKARIARRSWTNFALYFGATPNNLSEITQLSPREIPAVKVFLASSTGSLLVTEERVVRTLFAQSPVRLAFHSEAERLIQQAMAAYYGKDWDVVPDLHTRVRPTEACIESTRWLLSLAKEYMTPIHLLHITTGEEVRALHEFFEQAPQEIRSRVSAETCPVYLTWNSTHFPRYKNFLKCNPALKSPKDQEALWEGIRQGVFTTIGTDHAPHTYGEKLLPYWQAPAGVPTHPYLLPWLYTLGNQRGVPLRRWVELLAWRPARLWGIQERGFLREGYWADLVLFDPVSETHVPHPTDPQTLNKCGWHPLMGETLQGRVQATWVNGYLSYDKGYILGAPAGEPVAFTG